MEGRGRKKRQEEEGRQKKGERGRWERRKLKRKEREREGGGGRDGRGERKKLKRRERGRKKDERTLEMGDRVIQGDRKGITDISPYPIWHE